MTTASLFLTDRSADLIVRGGVNIYPAEVEAVLLQHPAVRDAAVVGVPNAEWGEEVKGVVERVAEEAPADLERELIDLLPRAARSLQVSPKHRHR